MAEEPNNVDKAVLILNIQNIDHLSDISHPITAVATRARKRLLIVIFSPFFDNPSGADNWDPVQKLLTHVYVQATSVSQKWNKILMSVDVLLRGVRGGAEEFEEPLDGWSRIFYSGKTEGLPIPQAWLFLPAVHFGNISEPSMKGTTLGVSIDRATTVFPTVALGGTFDHLHAGHKILLSMAAWIAGEKIIVGVTDDVLLTRKVHKELLEPLSARLEAVREFIGLFKPGLVCDVVPITDVYGPTAWDPNIQALVVSKETLPGAAAIASLRAEKDLPPLKTFVIDVISAVSADLGTDDPEALKNAKMSSTFIRQWIYERGMEDVHAREV